MKTRKHTVTVWMSQRFEECGLLRGKEGPWIDNVINTCSESEALHEGGILERVKYLKYMFSRSAPGWKGLIPINDESSRMPLRYCCSIFYSVHTMRQNVLRAMRLSLTSYPWKWDRQ